MPIVTPSLRPSRGRPDRTLARAEETSATAPRSSKEADKGLRTDEFGAATCHRLDLRRGKERVSQARAGVASAHLKWLNQRLSNEPSLLQRLTELCDEVPMVAKLVVRDDRLAFARQVRDARNLRTHLDFTHGSSPANLGLVALTAQLAVILEAAVLVRELGFNDHDAAQRVERGSRLFQLAAAAARQANR